MMLARVVQEENHPLLGSSAKSFALGHPVSGSPADHHSTPRGKGSWLEEGCGEPLGCMGWGIESFPSGFLTRFKACSKPLAAGFHYVFLTERNPFPTEGCADCDGLTS